MNTLAPLLGRFHHSGDQHTAQILSDFRTQYQNLGGSPLKSTLALYLEQHFAPLRKITQENPPLTFEEVFCPAGDRELLILVSAMVLSLLEKDSKVWSPSTGSLESLAMNSDGTVALLNADSDADIADKVFAIGRFWLRLMLNRSILFDELPEKSSFEAQNFEQTETRELKKSNGKNEWIWSTFFCLDVSSGHQMLELAQIFHQMVIFDPLIYHVEKQKFRFWSAFDARLPEREIQAQRAKRTFIGRLAIDCVRTESEDLAMVAFLSKKLLRLGYYEVFDDLDDLKEEGLVMFDHSKAMRTIYQALMASESNRDVSATIRRAQTILRSFREEVETDLDPPLPVSITFTLNGKQIRLEVNGRDLIGASEVLECALECLEKIKSIPDIQHVDLYEKVFLPDIVHEHVPNDTCHNLR